MNETFTISTSGSFSLRESVEFGFGQRHSERFDDVMRLAFVLDGSEEQVGVEVTQRGFDVQGRIVGGQAEVAAVRRQVARVLSLDHDAQPYDDLGAHDPVVGRLQAAAPGLRPPLFYSPYEAAVWSVLGARRATRQMMKVREALSRAAGATFDVAGRTVAALPSPTQLLEVKEFAGIEPVRLSRLHGVAQAAREGQLDVDRLRELGPERAAVELQRIPGIGPFYSSLIVIRAIGFTDVLPLHEPRVLALVTELYELPAPVTSEQFEKIAAPWSPFRTWVAVLIRAATTRLADSSSAPAQTGTS